MKTYRIVTDAVSVDIAARDADEAAAKFSRNESVYYGYAVNGVADLIWAAKQMGGVVSVDEVFHSPTATTNKPQHSTQTHMKTQHTAGPWKLTDSHIDPDLCWSVSQDNGSKRGLLVAIAYRDIPSGESNARLIASAPELLEALRSMLDADDAICDNIGSKADQTLRRIVAIDKARLAIAKATGN